jgi:hypothetical protein
MGCDSRDSSPQHFWAGLTESPNPNHFYFRTGICIWVEPSGQWRRSVWNIGGPNSSPLPSSLFLLFPSLPFPIALSFHPFPSHFPIPSPSPFPLLFSLPLFPPSLSFPWSGDPGVVPRKILEFYIAVGEFNTFSDKR